MTLRYIAILQRDIGVLIAHNFAVRHENGLQDLVRNSTERLPGQRRNPRVSHRSANGWNALGSGQFTQGCGASRSRARNE